MKTLHVIPPASIGILGLWTAATATWAQTAPPAPDRAAATAAAPAVEPQPVGRGAYPDLAIDRSGGLHLVYVRDGRLYYRHRPAGRPWGGELDTGLAAGFAHRSDPEVAVDVRGRVHALVGSSYAELDGGVWARIDPGVERDTAMAADGHGHVYICRRGGADGGFLGLRVRRDGSRFFVALPDPDTAGGLPRGRNDHVYGHVFAHPASREIHLVYRHGAPSSLAYRVSSDGGATWRGAGIADDDFEAPSGLATRDGRVYVIGGSGTVWQRGDRAAEWRSLGRGLACGRRDLPVLAADGNGRLFAAAFGGRLNVWSAGGWQEERRLPAPNGQPLGFVALTGGDGGPVFAVWEEGRDVRNDEPAGESALWMARLDGDAAPPAAAASPAAMTAPRQAGQWDLWELAIEHGRTYADPVRDVSLEARFFRPDGTTVGFWGFHDGGRTWRLRCMPDRLGPWRYEARFSDGSGGATGTFECVASDLPGAIGVHAPNPVWFGFRGGGAALLRAFHVGDRFFARNWDDPDSDADGNPRAAVLDWAQSQGYNALSIASHYLNRDAVGRGRGWDTPQLWPPRPSEYARLERMLDDLARRRLLVYPFAGFFGRDSAFPRSPADQTAYIRYAYARLGPRWNLLFNVAGPEPALPGKPYLSHAEIRRLGAEIQRWNAFGRAVSVHNRTGDDEFRDEPWLSYGTLQGPKTVDRTALGRGLLQGRHPGKPLLAQETLWSGNVNHVRAIGRDYTDDDLRRNAVVIHFSAAALVFADNDGDSSSGFSGTLDLADRRQARHDAVAAAWNLCASLPFENLRPRPDLIAGAGVHCLADPGRRYLVYVESAERVSVQIESGPYRVRWIDARPPYRSVDGGMTRDGQSLSPPVPGRDWILELTATATAP